MVAGGVIPTEEGDPDAAIEAMWIEQDKAVEFDRLMAEGGIEAVIRAVERQEI